MCIRDRPGSLGQEIGIVCEYENGNVVPAGIIIEVPKAVNGPPPQLLSKYIVVANGVIIVGGAGAPNVPSIVIVFPQPHVGGSLNLIGPKQEA